MKKVVIYYSRTGKTAVAAKALAEKIEGHIVEIKDLKNRKGLLRWLRAAMDARGSKITQIDPSNVNTIDYDTICFGTPVWAGKPTPAFNTMVKKFEITGKDVILFLTHGSNSGNSMNLMCNAVKAEGGNVIKTIEVKNSGKKSDDEIENEINSISL